MQRRFLPRLGEISVTRKSRLFDWTDEHKKRSVHHSTHDEFMRLNQIGVISLLTINRFNSRSKALLIVTPRLFTTSPVRRTAVSLSSVISQVYRHGWFRLRADYFQPNDPTSHPPFSS